MVLLESQNSLGFPFLIVHHIKIRELVGGDGIHYTEPSFFDRRDEKREHLLVTFPMLVEIDVLDMIAFEVVYLGKSAHFQVTHVEGFAVLGCIESVGYMTRQTPLRMAELDTTCMRFPMETKNLSLDSQTHL